MKRMAFLFLLAPLPNFGSLLEAVFRSPEVLAAREEVEAAEADSRGAGLLADPQLEGMASRVEMPEGENPMWEARLTQPLSRGGERRAQRQRALARVHTRRAELAQTLAETHAQAAGLRIQADAAAAREALLRAQAERMHFLLDALDTRAAVAQASASERLRAESALEDLRLWAEEESRIQHDALDALRSLLGLPDEAPSPPLPPLPDEVADPDKSPAALVLSARRDERLAEAAIARASARPMGAIALRVQREETNQGDLDQVGIAFMTDLPFRARRAADASLEAIEHDLSALGQRRESLRLRIDADLRRAARAAELAEHTRRVAGQTRARIEAETQALLRTAGTERAPDALERYVDLLERLTRSELRALTAQAEADTAQAGLLRYQNLPQPEPETLP